MQDPNIINLLLQTPYKSIKFMDGIDIGKIIKKITLTNKEGKNKEIIFKNYRNTTCRFIEIQVTVIQIYKTPN